MYIFTFYHNGRKRWKLCQWGVQQTGKCQRDSESHGTTDETGIFKINLQANNLLATFTGGFAFSQLFNALLSTKDSFFQWDKIIQPYRWMLTAKHYL